MRKLRPHLRDGERLLAWAFSSQRLDYWFATNMALYVVPTPAAKNRREGWVRSGIVVQYVDVACISGLANGDDFILTVALSRPLPSGESALALTSQDRSANRIPQIVASGGASSSTAAYRSR